MTLLWNICPLGPSSPEPSAEFFASLSPSYAGSLRSSSIVIAKLLRLLWGCCEVYKVIVMLVRLLQRLLQSTLQGTSHTRSQIICHFKLSAKSLRCTARSNLCPVKWSWQFLAVHMHAPWSFLPSDGSNFSGFLVFLVRVWVVQSAGIALYCEAQGSLIF